MTKQITKERLLETLKKIREHYDYRSAGRDEVVRKLASLGFQSAVAQQFGNPKPDPSTVGLSPDLMATPNSEAAVKQVLREWHHNIQHSRAQREWVFRIQEAHEISGLEDKEFAFGAVAITYPWAGEDLPLISSDLTELRKHKMRVVEFFLHQAERHQLALWRYFPPQGTETLGDWKPSSPEIIMAIATSEDMDWASLFGSLGELHLSVGHGVEIDTLGRSIHVCASTEIPPL